MTDSRHGELRHLFDRALELPPKARIAFLDKKCHGDLELRRRLEGMLAAADDQPAGEPAGATPTPADAAPVREDVGSSIGPYKLLQLIGEGGFGSVFLAEQRQPVQRQVALKILKLGMDTRQVVARFEQERQALALMDHPNIARVLDAGATATGRPYFVMDLVKGEPISDYCDKNHVAIEERLELFAQVCHAVQHAHGKGVIHRDIKPSNVLVGVQDGKAQARVIDFGIAKATASKLTDKTLFTEQAQVIGTLQYMSPEQAEGSLDIDTRTDVYSLGILLYELLAGSTPFDSKTVKSALFGELHRMIREVEPPKPSTRISDSRDTLAAIAACRGVEPKRLGMLVRGELDWIVMKAIEKDRTRRYETADGLAMDIARYLRGEVVTAAPPSAAYRLRKFVRRNKGAAAAAAAVAAALLLGAVGFAWQARLAGIERDHAVLARSAEERERQKAEESAAAEAKQRAAAESSQQKAAAINKFLLDMLGSADVRKLGRDAKVAQALDQAAASVGTSFRDRPEVEAAVRQILGRTYASLGMLEAAEPHIEAGLAMNRRLYGEQSTEVARSLSDAAAVKTQRGDYKGAATLLREGVDIAVASTGAESGFALGVKSDYANALVKLERTDEAEELLREVVEARRRLTGSDSFETLIAINSLAVLLHDLKRLDEAEPLYREAVEIGDRALGAEHADTLTARMNLASILRSRGELNDAEPLMAAAYPGIKKVFGDAHTQTASAAWSFALVKRDLGKFTEALPLLEDCVAIRQKTLGQSSEGVAEAKQTLAMTLDRLGESARAAAAMREVVAVWQAVDGDTGERTLGSRLDLANLLTNSNAKPEAEQMFRALLDECPRELGDDHRLAIIVLNSYGVFLMRSERWSDAEGYVRQALEAGRRVEGAHSRDTLITQTNLAGVLLELGRLDEAESLAREAASAMRSAFSAKHANVAAALLTLGETLVELGRQEDAERVLTEAVQIRRTTLGARSPGFASATLTLADLFVDTGRAAQAEPRLRDGVDILTQARGAKDARTANARILLGKCLARQARFADAEKELGEALGVLVAARPATHKDLRRAHEELAALYTAWDAAEPGKGHEAQAAAWRGKAAAGR